jgi:hypothetical protein
LKVTLDGVELKPGFALGSWVAFEPEGDQAMVMGDLVLTETEVGPVMQKLADKGFEITAAHNHLLRGSPTTLYMHIMGHGEPVALATALHDALALSKTPLTDSYFTLARKLGVASVPMSACLVAIEAAPGDPAAAPWTAGAWRVTSAVYSPCTIPLTWVVAVKPSICVPPATGLVTVQVRLGVSGTSSGSTSGYPPIAGVRPDVSEENSHPAGTFTDPSTKP